MANGVLMPKQGITVESCVISEWRKKVGDEIKTGDVLFSYETDKASFECESTASGTLLAIFFEDGDEVPVLTNVCAVGKPGEDFSSLRPDTADKPADAPAAAEPEKRPAPAAAQAPAPAPAPVPAPAVREEGGFLKISPRARNAARRLGVDPATAVPSGPYGRIIERDLAGAAAFTPAAAAAAVTASEGTAIGGRIGTQDSVKKAEEPAPAEYTDEKLTTVRKSIASAMYASLHESAQLTHHFSFDASQIMKLRAEWKAGGEKLGLPNITLNDIVMFAVSRVVREHPYCNAHYLGDRIRLFSGVNLGMAVDTPRGLLVPTIFGADRLSLAELSVRAKKLAKEAQSGAISPDDLTGGTITVSNLGTLGVELFTPIINPPQTCIIGVCNIQTKVRLEEGQPVFYPAMGLSLTYDHRAVDGAPASRFMQELCRGLENFTALMAK